MGRQVSLRILREEIWQACELSNPDGLLTNLARQMNYIAGTLQTNFRRSKLSQNDDIANRLWCLLGQLAK